MLSKLKEIRNTVLKAVEKSQLAYEDINEGILVDAYNFECVFEKTFNVSFKYKYYRETSSKKHTIVVKLDEGYTCFTYDRGSVHLASIDEVCAFVYFFFDYCKNIIYLTNKLGTISHKFEMSNLDMRKYLIDKLLDSDL